MLGSKRASSDLFRSDAVDPETAAFNVQLASIQATAPEGPDIGPLGMRAHRHEQWQAAGGASSALAQQRSLPGPAAAIPARVLVPERVRGVFLHFHGGGMVLGDALYSDLRNEAIARNCELAVVSVNYRLAPEHRYPAGHDDCEAAALWLAANVRAEFGSDTLLIGGDSAGANLAVGTLVRLRDRHGVTPFRAASLVYGVYDWVGTPSSLLNGAHTLVLTSRAMRWFAEQYLPDDRQRRHPDAAPLWASLENLPPALFSVGTLDPLLDDSLFMHARWLAAGNASELAVYPGGTHGFTSHPTPIARQANDRIEAFLRAAGRDPC